MSTCSILMIIKAACMTATNTGIPQVRTGHCSARQMKPRFATQPPRAGHSLFWTAVPAGSVVRSYAKQILATLLPTLLVEGLLLIPFGFPLRRNWKVFLLANLGTQVLLTATLGFVAMQGALWSVYLLFVPVELVIFVTEALVYRRRLHSNQPEPHPVV